MLFAGEHKAALDHVRELEEKLKSQREEAEQKAQQVKESEDLQTARLRAMADVIEGNVLCDFAYANCAYFCD